MRNDFKKNLMLQETYNPGQTIQRNALNPNDPLNIHVFIITSGLQNGSSVTTIIVLSAFLLLGVHFSTVVPCGNNNSNWKYYQ